MKTLLFTNEWEKYFVTVDDKLSQIKVDLGAREFKDGFNHSFFVRIYHEFQGDFPNLEEEKKITQFLEFFEAALIASETNAKYIGSVSSKEVIDFVFVAKELFELEPILDKILSEYKYQSSWLKDDMWNIYESLLFPSEEDLIFIYNRKLLQEYHGNHDAMRHEVYQYQVFHDQKDAQNFITDVYQDFKVLDTILTQDKMYIVQLVREEEMSFIDLNQVSLKLMNLAKKHQGHYVSCHYEDVHKEAHNA